MNQSGFPSLMEVSQERLHLGTSPTNYSSSRGFGVTRHGFNNPTHLDRNPRRASKPWNRSRSRPRQTYDRARSASPVLNECPSTITQEWKNRQESPVDHPMITPDRSRTSSLVEQETTNIRSNAHLQFGVPTPIRRPEPVSNQEHDPYSPNLKFSSRDRYSVASIFNPTPASPMDIEPAHPTSHTYRHPTVHTHSSSSTRTISPYSKSSDSTLLAPSFQEKRYFHLVSLQSACLAATSSYLSDIHRHSRFASRRYYPYAPPVAHSHPHRHSGSLMDNIAAICTHLWGKARSDGMAPHRAEAGAVGTMRDLYVWGEKVVEGLESEGVWDEGENGVWDGYKRVVEVARAAEMMCRVLRDRTARREVADVLRILRAEELGGRSDAGID